MEHPSYPSSEILSHPVNHSYPASEILSHPVNPGTEARRHSQAAIKMTSSASTSVATFCQSQESEKKLAVRVPDGISEEDSGGKSDEENEDRRPSFAEIQGEDIVRRPSVTDYQCEDSDHPDIKSIQDMVADITFH